MIVGIVSTYNEGRLAAGAVRCLQQCCEWVYVCDGPIAGAEFDGPATDPSPFLRDKRLQFWQDTFESEHEKRNAMLERVRARRFPAPVWGVYLDGDELLLGAAWLPDLIEAATGNVPEGEQPASIPVPISEVDGSVGRVHRILRLDLLERHVLSMSQFVFQGSSTVVTLPLLPVWRPGEPETAFARRPLEGEPHIHHRAYYRPVREERKRLHALEVDDFKRLEQEAGVGGGGSIPREQEGSFVPTEDLSQREQEAMRALLDPLQR